MVRATAPYRPGEFYLRELPPLRTIIPASGDLALIVIDGYVDLDPMAGSARMSTPSPALLSSE